MHTSSLEGVTGLRAEQGGAGHPSPREPLTLEWQALPAISAHPADALLGAIRDRSPVVVEDLAAEWPALERWTLAHLQARYGDRPVRVYDASFGRPGRGYMSNVDTMPFAEFLDATQRGGRDLRMFLYNLAHQIPELVDDIRLPQLGLRFSRQFVFSFFGCQGSTTPLHYDIDMGEVFHTVVRGKRRIRLFAPDCARALYAHPFTVRSYVDLDAPHAGRFPALRHAHGYEVVLEPGQTLYMPAGWWHEFHYLEAGYGVSLRASSPLWRDRIRGWTKLLCASPIDRVANRIAPERWFCWKTGYAEARAQALLREFATHSGMGHSQRP